MVYLLLTILLSSTFSLMMKHAHARAYGVLAVGCLNYVAAGVVGVVWATTAWSGPVPPLVLFLGCVGGTMYVLCYVSIMVLLDRQGIAVASAVTRMAIALPVLVSVVAWHEVPTAWQQAGLATTFVAILAFAPNGQRLRASGLWRRSWPLAACFVTAGVARLAMKTFTELCGSTRLPAYVGAWFGFAGLIALGMLLIGRIRPRGGDWPFGIVLGVVNVGTLLCSIRALDRVPAIVFFPATAAGSLALVTVLAAAVWRERLDKRTRWGLACACAALLLVHSR